MSATKNSEYLLTVFGRIAQERLRQQALFHAGKFNFTCSSTTADNNRKLRVLTEEVGEVADAIEQIEKGTLHKSLAAKRREHLREELVQVAAVAVAWLESLEEKS